MNTVKNQPYRNDNDLERVIEPLASYLCAADEPKAALRMALSILFSEVQRTNGAARARVAAFSAKRWS
jgi:hypothetical protein